MITVSAVFTSAWLVDQDWTQQVSFPFSDALITYATKPACARNINQPLFGIYHVQIACDPKLGCKLYYIVVMFREAVTSDFVSDPLPL